MLVVTWTELDRKGVIQWVLQQREVDKGLHLIRVLFSTEAASITGYFVCERGEDSLFKLDKVTVEFCLDQHSVFHWKHLLDVQARIIHILETSSRDDGHLISFEYAAHVFLS